MASEPKPTDVDTGAALLAWYADAAAANPEGLVSQAQAAAMLGLGRMAVSRLVARGYLRAVYFPKPPEIEGVTVGEDDPTWLKVLGWFGSWANKLTFPKVCYVSFADVMELWLRGDARNRCQPQWRELVARIRSKREEVRQFHDDCRTRHDLNRANLLIEQNDDEKDNVGRLGSIKVYMHDELLEWFQAQGETVGLSRNQLVMWAAQQWKSRLEHDGTEMDTVPRLPIFSEVERIQGAVTSEASKLANTSECRYFRIYDEFNGGLGIISWGLRLDGKAD